MTREEILLNRLERQHLLHPAKSMDVVTDLCGLQAQYLSHALHALSLRAFCADTAGMVKSWTIRGTMHVFAEKDLPLFLHRGRSHFLRSVDTLESDPAVSAQRKQYFASLILDAVGSGTESRSDLKALCTQHGMLEAESASLFDPWGGIIRALCEEGKLCHQVSEQKAYRLCPEFIPMEAEEAQLELARRYFTHYGPATVRDSASFFGCTQREVRQWLSKLPVLNTEYEGKQYFWLEAPAPISQELPPCLFLAGFDPLLLGYEKKDSLILPQAHLRQVYTLSGIVRPVVLMWGQAVGYWGLKNRKLTVTLFSPADRTVLLREAEAAFPALREISIENPR